VSPLVIDASIAIKWVIEEEGTKEALALRSRALSAPDLLIAECANILWKKVRRKRAFGTRRHRSGTDPALPRSRSQHRVIGPMTASISPSPKPKDADLLLLTGVWCARRASGRYADRVIGLSDAPA
jgi:hypothetical protein